jgi:hypothetical protein
MVQDLEWSNVPGCQLTFDMEVLHTLERCDSKVDKVSHIEGDRSPLWVSITLLS